MKKTSVLFGGTILLLILFAVLISDMILPLLLTFLLFADYIMTNFWEGVHNEEPIIS